MIINSFGLIYLLLLPLFVFALYFHLPYLWISLFITLLLIFSRFKLALFLCLILLFFFPLKFIPDLGLMNAINSQRGEHSLVLPFLGRFLHNKTDLGFQLVDNFHKFLSPSSIFTGWVYPKLDPHYPLGLLFPWDIIFLIYIFIKNKYKFNSLKILFFCLLLILITLNLNSQLNQIFVFSLVIYLSFLIAKFISLLPKKFALALAVLNLCFIIAHLIIVPKFIIP